MHYYQLKLDDHRAFGFAWVVPNGQSPNGSGAAAFAGRLLFRSELSNLKAKHGSADAHLREGADQALYAESESSTKEAKEAPYLTAMRDALTEYVQRKH